MIRDREAEKTKLKAVLTSKAAPAQKADILPHPILLEQFSRKVEALRASLDDDAIRPEAATVLSTLIESVTIYPAGEHGAAASRGTCTHRYALAHPLLLPRCFRTRFARRLG
jgi:site-specific DNA recombinase